ncbi:MAG: helix-turn-helix transcriptional regulator [Akkermansiaceae bacterium]|nr:helix-turn-helix transcriptional regulator [Akkermansiaceae bacterium]
MVILSNAAELGKEIRFRRESLGVTLQQLADLTGIGINTLSRLERGVGGVTLKTLLVVLQTLGLKLGMETERS